MMTEQFVEGTANLEARLKIELKTSFDGSG